MNVLRMVMLRQFRAPAADALERVHRMGGPAHQLQDARAAVLERDVEVGQHLALGHQRDHVVHVRVRIDVVQPHPGAELAEFAREVDEAARDLAAAPLLSRYLRSAP